MAEQALLADLRFGLGSLSGDASKTSSIASKMASDVERSLSRINSSSKGLPGSFNDLNKSLNQTASVASNVGRETGKLGGILNSLKGGLAALGIGVTASAFTKLAGEAYNSAVSLQAVERQLTKTAGSSAEAQRQLAFVREESQRLGTSTLEGAKGFVAISNAALGTVAEGEGVKQIFSAINELTAANSLSAQQYGTILTQTTQAISKGKAELSDLKIIAEAGVPVFQLLAKGLNTSPDKIFEAISKGKVTTKELLVLFQQVREEYGTLATEASRGIPANFSKITDQVSLAFADAFRGVLDSTELQELVSKLAEIKPGSLFPSTSEITASVNNAIEEYRAFAGTVSVIFEATKQSILQVLDGITGYFSEKVGGVVQAASGFISKLPGGDALLGFFAKLNEKVSQGINNLANYQGLISDILGKDVSKLTNTEQLTLLTDKLKGGGVGDIDPKERVENIRKFEAALKSADKEILAENEKTANAASQAYIDANQKTVDDFKNKGGKSDEENKRAHEKALKERQRQEERHADVVAKLNQDIINRRIDAEEKVNEAVKKYEEEQLKDKLDAEKRHADEVAKLNQEIIDRQIQAQQEVDALTEKVRTEGPKAVFNKPLSFEEKQSQEQWQDTFGNLKGDLQSTLADTISGAFKGDLGNVENVFDNIVDIAANTSGKIISALTIDKSLDTLFGPEFKESGKVGGIIGKGLDKLSVDIQGQHFSGQQVLGAAAGAAAGGLLAGSVGKKVGEATGNRTVGIATGAVGGAIAGAYAGSVVPVYGTIIGGVIGGAAGAVQGGLFAKEPKKTQLSVQTTEGVPAQYEAGALKKGPFGNITLFNETSSATNEAANSALLTIAEVDATIAKYLDKTQREIVKDFLQQPSLEDTHVAAQDANEAIAKAVQLRYFHAIQALTDTATAENVVGKPFEATSGDIETIQKRANEALGILKLIEEFRIGPLSDTAQQIKKINDYFQGLVDTANNLGLPIDELLAEQQRQLAEVTKNFDRGIHDEILKISDPKQYDFEQLEKARAEDVQNAIDSNGDVAQVEYLYNLKRQQLEEKYAEKVDETDTRLQDLMRSMEDFNNRTLSQTSQSLLALQKQYDQLVAQANALGVSTDTLTASYSLQVAEIKQAARVQVFSALYGVTDPFYASLVQINQQVYEFQKLVNEGLIDQGAVTYYQQVAYNQARYNEALRIANGDLSAQATYQKKYNDFARQGLGLSQFYLEIQKVREDSAALAASMNFLGISTRGLTESTNRQIAQIKAEAAGSVVQAINQYIKPIDNAFAELSKQAFEFQELVAEGLVPQSFVNLFRQLAQGATLVDKAVNAISGGRSSPITQVADAFQQFVDAGLGRSQAQQQMYDLTTNFARLADAANILGLSTKDLQDSYIRQANQIRNDNIKAIDQEFSARRGAIEQINDYLKSLKTADDLPYNLRLDEAQKQFQDAVKSGNLEDSLQAGQQYQQIAREAYGSTAEYFTARSEVEGYLTALRDQESARIEEERNAKIRQEQYSLQMIEQGRSSVDYLRQLNAHQNDAARGIEQLIAFAKQDQQLQGQTYQLLRRTVSKIGA